LPQTVLVVDDEKPICTFIAAGLKRANINCLMAHAGNDAIQMVREGATPDLILCDLNMPGGGGVETIVALRNFSATQHTPIILIAGLLDAYTNTRLKGLGICRILEKPFNMAELLVVIEHCLDHCGTPGATA
jgi:DNA-binding response OmpR family regulator